MVIVHELDKGKVSELLGCAVIRLIVHRPLVALYRGFFLLGMAPRCANAQRSAEKIVLLREIGDQQPVQPRPLKV